VAGVGTRQGVLNWTGQFLHCVLPGPDSGRILHLDGPAASAAGVRQHLPRDTARVTTVSNGLAKMQKSMEQGAGNDNASNDNASKGGSP
jgi:hypothetical protein